MEKRFTAPPLWCAAAAVMCCVGVGLAQDKAEPPKPAPTKAEPKKTEKKEEVTLKVGDKAPALTVSKWVKGEPITGFEKGRVYVVECWATWCGPCKKAIPHVTELQAKYKDKGVTIVGMSVWEHDQSKVEPFVKDQGDKMNYTVAMDDVPKDGDEYSGAIAKNWLKAAGKDGIPCSFVVGKDSKIAWIGHPTFPAGALDRVLGAVVDGTFDAKKEAERADQEAKQAKTEAEARAAVGKVIRGAMADEDWDAAIKALDKLSTEYPAAVGMIGVQKFMVLLTKKEDYTAAYALAARLGDNELKNDETSLNTIAWTMIDPQTPEISKRDYVLAEKLATRACEITKFENGMILDTLALACFKNGKVDRAIELQTKAVKLTPQGDQSMDEIEGRLEEYKKAKKPSN